MTNLTKQDLKRIVDIENYLAQLHTLVPNAPIFDLTEPIVEPKEVVNEVEEKAMELVNKYLDFDYQLIKEYMPNPIGCAKQCAIIAVDEILQLKLIEDKDLQETTKSYWQEVKNHLKKL